jgi:FtsP/CotA-like multicopper oxidase with cupredoxin domain
MHPRTIFIGGLVVLAGLLVLSGLSAPDALAQPPYCDDTNAVPGGSLSPCVFQKYTEPLIVPPAMPRAGKIKRRGAKNIDYYEIEVVEFMQQILPPGQPMTRVWSYGALGHPMTRNYPAFTIEAKRDKPVRVKWINNLVDPLTGNYLPHLLTNTVDQTVHWANPPQECADNTVRTDCKGTSQLPYQGPVPIITHVHGAHVGPESDGYPEAWWLPAANNIPAGFANKGTLYDQYDRTNVEPGTAVFQYPNDQRATTLWYHDHSLGMTRLNVYAGPAGFYIIRGKEDLLSGILPEPAPALGDPPGMQYYEIPIVIQDRSFNSDGSLFYPNDREFFEGLFDPGINTDLQIPFAPDSDVLSVWNPEAFFNTMVVNGRTWPFLDVDRGLYRFRLLNGCNSRFLNLAMFVVDPLTGDIVPTQELPFYVTGTEGGLLPQVVKVQTDEATALPGDGTIPAPVPGTQPGQALLVGPAERADVLVDFAGLPAGTRVRMVNTAPDAPFGGLPDTPADPATTGQVMEFVVGANAGPAFTAPQALVLAPRVDLIPGNLASPRQVSLNEEESLEVCVEILSDGTISHVPGVFPPDCDGLPGVVPFGPTAALLGTYDSATMITTPLLWSQDITENPALGSTEQWEIWNFTADAHPIHLHLVQFQVVDRQAIGVLAPYAPEPWEAGWKDTVIAYPGEITRINAMFDIEGLYVWHCHIVEHEDNEMMRPYYVGDPCASPVPVAGAVCPPL